MKMKSLFTSIIILVFISLCHGQNDDLFLKNHPGIHRVTVIEVLQTTSYTYLLVKEKDDTQWLAMPKIEAEVGETYLYQGGNEMRDFKSTQLNRTFKSVLFLGGVMNAETLTEKRSAPASASKTTKENAERTEIKIDPIEGAITIAELFSHKKKYVDKSVKIKGKVVKFTESIMKRNWIHLQDGTEYEGEFDLVITTDNKVETGQIVVIEGKVALDKDFGYGYFYKVIMEEGKVIK